MSERSYEVQGVGVSLPLCLYNTHEYGTILSYTPLDPKETQLQQSELKRITQTLDCSWNPDGETGPFCKVAFADRMLTTSGTKFNCRKEDAEGEDYLGIRVFRFYFKCTRCSAELAMKTDPKNSDYIMEAGATRNFEPWREKDAEVRRRRSPLCIRQHESWRRQTRAVARTPRGCCSLRGKLCACSIHSHNGPIRCQKRGYILTTYQSDARSAGIFSQWTNPPLQRDIATAQREAEETGDAMKALENRTLDSKREMDILSALDEMKALSSRHATNRTRGVFKGALLAYYECFDRMNTASCSRMCKSFCRI
eukprot:1192944-Prorocentrum_minimum.AAC.6